MPTLKSFHILLIALAIVLTAGVGAWGVFSGYRLLGTVSLAGGAALIVYWAYFASRAQQMHLR